jgi:OmcA/MtrC family decaheme c-type cytochrome
MNRFIHFRRWSWSILVVSALAFSMGGCSGDDGKDGADGRDGIDGQDGQDAPVPSAVQAAIDTAQVESCGTCHGDAGAYHQAEYDKYAEDNNPNALTMTFDDLDVVAAVGGGFDLTLDFSIWKNGAPYIDPIGARPSFDSLSIYVAEYDSATGEFYNSAGGFAFGLSASNAASNGDGTYTLVQNVPVNPTTFGGGAIMGRLVDGLLDTEDDNYAPSDGRRVQMYADNAAASWLIGDMAAFDSPANVDACAACHGTPYRKHGNSPGMVAGAPDFTYCRGCHNDTANGGHKEWQQEQDDALTWATDGLAGATQEQLDRWDYKRTLLNDVHMSHAMHLPYPQSMGTCNTCHEGKLAQVLDNSNFTWETCQSCHVLEGIGSWPDDGTGDPEQYNQAHRPPAFAYLWQRDADLTFHDLTLDCQGCHGAGVAREFSEYHNGFDPHIYDDTGQRWSDLYTLSIDSVSMAGDVMTVEFSGDPAIVPELLVSFYGWDTKHFIVGSHERDANVTECAGRRPGCQMEYVPESSGGSPNPLFAEDAASAPGAWIVTLDVSLLQLTKTDLLPTLIANGDVTKAEISLTPELNLGGVDVALEAVSDTFDIASNAIVANYFAGTDEIVSIDKCNACHDDMGVLPVHDGSGRFGDGMQVCRACHTTTFPGSHLEMQSRSIDSYVHAIHSFQPFDIGDVDPADPVEVKRTEAHKKHKFPFFTALACEGCHVDDFVAGEVRYNVPDQFESMPGVSAASDTVADRSIGSIPEYVTGPASRSCGSCHRAVMINKDHAGTLASFNAHTETFGTYAENLVDDDGSEDKVLFGIIDKIMTWFE